jgi:hypothetical protein
MTGAGGSPGRFPFKFGAWPLGVRSEEPKAKSRITPADTSHPRLLTPGEAGHQSSAWDKRRR